MTNALQLFSFVFGVLSMAVVTSQAAISILDPNSSVTWYTNNTVTVKWSSAATDPSPFRILLNNPNQSVLNGNASIADSVPTANEQVTILLPLINEGTGYILYFINPNATSQVYAASQPFTIAAGNITTSSGTASPTIASSTFLPGPVQTFPTSSQVVSSSSASASATQKSSASARFGVDAGSVKTMVVALMAVAFMCVATL